MQQQNLSRVYQVSRLFLASFVDAENFYDYEDVQKKLPEFFNCRLKFVEKENLHLTWKFIGETENSAISEIIDFIEKTVSETPEITVNFDKFQVWPDLSYPKQLVITGDDMENTGSGLYEALNTGLKPFGIKKDKRKFNPHITVARFRLKQKPKEKMDIPDWLDFRSKKIVFNRLGLIKSRLTPNGSIYETIKNFHW